MCESNTLASKQKINCNPKYGEIYYADLSGNQGSEQGGFRPVLIIQNDVGNKYSPTTIALAITSKMYKVNLPTHIVIKPEESGLSKESMVLAEQIRTVDKSRFGNKIGYLDDDVMQKVVKATYINLNSSQVFQRMPTCMNIAI